MPTALAHCLHAPVHAAEITTFEAWAQRWFDAVPTAHAPIDTAIRLGYASDRAAWAFASAYQAALRALVPTTPPDTLLSLCVTEDTGNRPRDIQTRITPLPDAGVQVNGSKRWAMVGNAKTTLLVVGTCATDTPSATPHLRVVQIPLPSAGLSVQSTTPTRFVPEVPHCAVQFDAVHLGPDALLPGDGYMEYMKPFRTLEDVYVSAATLAYLLREARAHQWPQDFVERSATALAALQALAAEPPLDAATHVALAGVLSLVGTLRAEATALWSTAQDACAERWRRDAALFNIAELTRRTRRDRAWERLRQASAP